MTEAKTSAEWIAQISLHEKGFWQADLFHGMYAEEPETFFTMKTGQTKDDCIAKAKTKWPHAQIYVVEEDDDDDGQDDEWPSVMDVAETPFADNH